MRATVAVLGSTQTLAWASSYYLPAILAVPIARDLGVSNGWVFGAFSISLMLSALLGPRVGRTIDRFGGREVLGGSSVVLALGLVVLAVAETRTALCAAWLVLGVGMSLGLYDAAFAVLGRAYGDQARRAITGITLIAGFASTVGWPLSAWGVAELGWRDTCLAWAAANVLIGLPLNRFTLPRASTGSPEAAPGTPRTPGTPATPVRMDATMWVLGFSLAAAWMVTAAMAVHLPRILETAGATPVEAVAAGMLVGPAQVGARLLEAGFLSRYHPLVSLRLALTAHPAGAALLALTGGVLPATFVVLHGAGNGILTIARGTVPLAIYGSAGYGHRLGLLGAPARIAQAAAPWLFGLLVDRLGTGVLVVTSGLMLAALGSLRWVRAPAAPCAPAPGGEPAGPRGESA